MDTLFTAPGIDGYLCAMCVEPMEEAEEVLEAPAGVIKCTICQAAGVPSWERIDGLMREYLQEWYNCILLDVDDKALLAALYHAGNFFAGTCGHCDADILRGEPDDWGDFQGCHNDEGSGNLCGDCTALSYTLDELRTY